MKKSLNLILIILISSSFINAESSKIKGFINQVTCIAKSKANQLKNTFDSLSGSNKVLTVTTPINLLAITLGYKLIKNGKENRALAVNVQNYPENNLDAIRDYCANYKETHTATGYSNGQIITTIKSNPSLFQTYINVKSEPEKLKDFAFLISKYMKDSADDQVFAGYFIPFVTLAGSALVYGMAASK